MAKSIPDKVDKDIVNTQLLSISDLAERWGISRQAVLMQIHARHWEPYGYGPRNMKLFTREQADLFEIERRTDKWNLKKRYPNGTKKRKTRMKGLVEAYD